MAVTSDRQVDTPATEQSPCMSCHWHLVDNNNLIATTQISTLIKLVSYQRHFTVVFSLPQWLKLRHKLMSKMTSQLLQSLAVHLTAVVSNRLCKTFAMENS